MKAHRLLGLPVLVLVLCMGDSDAAQTPKGPPITGRWDLTIRDSAGEYPSWLEVTLSGRKTLVGRFVGHFGSSRPIGEVFFKDGHVKFSLPPQWEERKTELAFDGNLQG